MYKTILMEEITLENATEKINEKVQEMEKRWLSDQNHVLLGSR